MHIPKTSGINFIKNSEIKAKNLTNLHIKFHKHFTHQPLWWWEERGLVKPLDTIFSIIRNPYDRFVSLYTFIKSLLPISDFDVFIRNDELYTINSLIKNDVGDLGNLLIWKVEWPQVKFIESKANNNVKLYKIENQLVELENFVGYKFANTHYNKINRSHWSQYYTKYSLDAIYTLYKEDFLSFEYKRNCYEHLPNIL
jgi:hypothetical protein